MLVVLCLCLCLCRCLCRTLQWISLFCLLFYLVLMLMSLTRPGFTYFVGLCPKRKIQTNCGPSQGTSVVNHEWHKLSNSILFMLCRVMCPKKMDPFKLSKLFYWTVIAVNCRQLLRRMPFPACEITRWDALINAVCQSLRSILFPAGNTKQRRWPKAVSISVEACIVTVIRWLSELK